MNTSPYYELYRRSSIGLSLIDTLDDLVHDGRIEPQLAMKVISTFDKCVAEVLADKVKARLNFKGHLDTYRFCDEVWTFLIKDVNFKLDNQNTVHAEKVKIVVYVPKVLIDQSDKTKNPHLFKVLTVAAFSSPFETLGTQTNCLLAPIMEASESSAEMYSSMKTSENGPLDPLRKISYKTSWLALAAASGACAAINGLFAKLTTTELTSAWSSAISGALGLVTPNKPIEFLIRAIFFLLNLTFNALMWALFTAALTRATSTTRVSIINTSSNFMVTALLGLAIFQENLPPLWWVGAGGLVVGTVTIGRREEEGGKERKVGPVAEEYRDRIGEGEDEISDGIEMGGNELKDRQKEGDTGQE